MSRRRLHADDVRINLRHLHRFANQRIQARRLFVDHGSKLFTQGIVQTFILSKRRSSRSDCSQRSAKFMRQRIDKSSTQSVAFSRGLQPCASFDCHCTRKRNPNLRADRRGNFMSQAWWPPCERSNWPHADREHVSLEALLNSARVLIPLD